MLGEFDVLVTYTSETSPTGWRLYATQSAVQALRSANMTSGRLSLPVPREEVVSGACVPPGAARSTPASARQARGCKHSPRERFHKVLELAKSQDQLL